MAAAGPQEGSPAPNTRFAGVAWALGGAASFAVMGGLVKAARPEVGTLAIIFWRCVVIAIVAHGLLRRAGHGLRPGSPKLMFSRSAAGLLAMTCFFYSLGPLELGTATALQCTSPLFTVLLAVPLLRDRLSPRALGLTAVAFVGVLLILRPDRAGDGVAGGLFSLDALIGLTGGLLAAGAHLSVRQLRHTDPPSRIIWWFAVSGAVVTAPAVLVEGLPGGATGWLFVLGVGLTATIGQYGMTMAYRLERPSVVSPLGYATVVLSYLAGLAAFGETPEPLALAGVALFIGAGALLARQGAA